MNISLFFCDVLVWKWGPGLEQAAIVNMATRLLQPLTRAFLCIPPEYLTACKIWREVENFLFFVIIYFLLLFIFIIIYFLFPKMFDSYMFDSYRDLFLMRKTDW